MANVKLDAMMKKITALLNNADDPALPTAAQDSYRAKAEDLMQKYRIEESTLIQQGALDVETVTPVDKIVDIAPSRSEYYNTYYNLMRYVVDHVGARMRYVWGYNDEGVHTLQAHIVGYESDIRFAEAIYLNARLVFADRMEPKYNGNLSDEDNVYRMRSAGIERIRIAYLMGWGGTGSATAKVTNMYKRACKARGEEPALTGRSTSVKAFREQYAESFATEFWNMLWRARNSRETGGAELVLAGREDAVNAAFYERFPDLKPKPALPYKDDRTDAQKARDERRALREMAKRMDRANSAGGRAGSRAGRTAAREVDVSATKRPSSLD